MALADPNDATPLSRWEPFILGMVAHIVNGTPAELIGLRLLLARPDPATGASPYLIVESHAEADDGAKQHYRITVEKITAPDAALDV